MTDSLLRSVLHASYRDDVEYCVALVTSIGSIRNCLVPRLAAISSDDLRSSDQSCVCTQNVLGLRACTRLFGILAAPPSNLPLALKIGTCAVRHPRNVPALIELVQRTAPSSAAPWSLHELEVTLHCVDDADVIRTLLKLKAERKLPYLHSISVNFSQIQSFVRASTNTSTVTTVAAAAIDDETSSRSGMVVLPADLVGILGRATFVAPPRFSVGAGFWNTPATSTPAKTLLDQDALRCVSNTLHELSIYDLHLEEVKEDESLLFLPRLQRLEILYVSNPGTIIPCCPALRSLELVDQHFLLCFPALRHCASTLEWLEIRSPSAAFDDTSLADAREVYHKVGQAVTGL